MLSIACELGLVLSVASCGSSRTGTRLAEAIAHGPGTIVDLAAITPANWTRVHVLNPYTPPAEVDSLLGFHWPEFQQEGLKERDDINLLVFVNGSRITDHLAFSRGLGDFCCYVRNAVYARERARFVVVRDSVSRDGLPWLRLRNLRDPTSAADIQERYR